MRLLVSGSRFWKDSRTVYWALRLLQRRQEAIGDPITVVIHGAAPGLDSLADACARGLGIDVEPVPADWDRYREPGRKNPAGPIRNRVMLNEKHPTALLAFHEDIAKSKGTKDMIALCRAAGLPVTLIQSANDLSLITGDAK